MDYKGADDVQDAFSIVSVHDPRLISFHLKEILLKSMNSICRPFSAREHIVSLFNNLSAPKFRHIKMLFAIID